MENLKSTKENFDSLVYPPNKTLLPFQIEAIRQMLTFLRNNDSTYNACEMGLGKSIQSLVAINTLFNELEAPNVLIICPSVMKYTWVSEIENWNINPKNNILVIDKASDLKGLIANYTIISYGLATKLAKDLSEFDWDVLILDESHYLKNHKSLRSKAIFTHLWPNIKYKIALSGTPFTTNVVDGWSIFSRMHESLKDYWRFVHTFTHVKKTPWGDKFEGLRNAPILSKIMRDNFYVRYLKKDVLKDLPDKIHQMVYLPDSFAVQSSDKDIKEHENYVKELKLALSRHSYQIPRPPISMMTLRREQGIKKLPFVIEYIQEFLDQEIPVIVFGVHKTFIKKLETHFRIYGPCVIIGETLAKGREDALYRFQHGSSLIFLANMQAAGVGITLTKSSHVILAEYDFIPSTISQAISRAHRIGQKDTVYVHHLIVKDSLEERILKIILQKQLDFNLVLD